MQESAHGNPNLTPFVVKKFTVNEITYVYDYTKLVKQQMDMASAVYQHLIDTTKKNLHNTLQEFLASDNSMHDVFVLSYILLKEKPDGSLEPFVREPNIFEWEKSPVFKFAANMPSKYESEVEEVIVDFFGKPSRFQIGSQVRGEITSDFVKNMVTQFQDMMAKQQDLSDFQGLIEKMSLNDVLPKVAQEAATGSSQTETQPNSTTLGT